MSLIKAVKYGLAVIAIGLILAGPTFKSPHRPLSLATLAESSSKERGPENIPLPAPGTSTARDLFADEIHAYQFTLDTNQYFHAVIEQQGIYAKVTLYGPSGQTLLQRDCQHYGPTPVSLISESSGVYRLEVRSLEKAQTPGRYQLRAEEIRSAKAKDNDRIAAEKTFAEGEQLLQEWRAESSRKAIDKFRDSLPGWQSVGDRRQEIFTLKRIGDVYQPLGDYQNALTAYNQALAISRQIKDRQSEGEILNDLSYVYLTWGNNIKAQKLCAQALKLSQSTGSQREKARTLNNLGEISYGSGKLQQSIEFYQRALQLWHEVGNREGQALTLLNFGYTYSDSGQVKEAFDSYNQALSLWQATKNVRGQAITLTAIGRLYSRMGESQEALSTFERAERLIKPIGDPIYEAAIFTGMAYIYDGLGEKQRAFEYYDRALLLFRAAGLPGGEASALGEIGRVYFSSGDNRKALEYHEHARTIFKAVGDHRMEIVELKEIGKVYDAEGDKTKALTYYLRAHSSYLAEKDLRGQAVTLNLIGHVFEERGQKEEALEYYKTALPISRKAENRVVEAATLHNIARVERNRGNLVTARERAEEALHVVESLREKVNSQDLRTSYFASVRQQYEFYIDLLMRLHHERPGEGFERAAFDASERARARSLIETLALARVGVRQNADPILLDQENRLSKELNEKAASRMRLQAGSEQADAAASTLAKEIDELTWRHREVEAQIRADSMKQTASLETRPLRLQEIQERVLGDDTLLLEYSLGEERSYLWAISKEEVLSYELPGRAEIEASARSVYDSLTANQPLPGDTFAERQARVLTANERLPSQIATLSRILLEPVNEKLETKRLLIVADGALQYIPFQILTKPNDPSRADWQTSAGAAALRPLMLDHEIVNEPSASALDLLIGDTTKRIQPANSVAVFADPVFEVDDPRIEKGSGIKSEVTSELKEPGLHRDLGDLGLVGNGAKISRLPASRDEADAVMAAVPWWSGRFKAMGFEATRSTAMSSDLSSYRIVHFATHGFLNDEHPELSGVVLSLFDQKGQPQDGFLRLHDIYNLKLNVDLVVLSACNTGLGKDVRGEGLIGLTRGFMYAGASSVIASLWKVDDEATAELMRLFYGYMLADGLSPAAALRKAQVTMSQQKRWQSPYYWAGFVIQGQYNQPERTKRFPTSYLALWLFGAATISAVSFYVLKRRRKRIV